MRSPFHSLLFQCVFPVEFSLVGVPPAKLSGETSFPYFKCRMCIYPVGPAHGRSCLGESINIYFLCTERIRSGFSGLHRFANHGSCSMWSRHPGCFPQHAGPTHGSVARIGVDASCPISTMEQLGLAKEVHALLQPFLVHLA